MLMDSGWIPGGFRMDSGQICWKNMDSVDSGHLIKREKYHQYSFSSNLTDSTESIFFQQIRPEFIWNPSGIHPESMDKYGQRP